MKTSHSIIEQNTRNGRRRCYTTQSADSSDSALENHILRKHLDRTSPEPLMANPTNAVLCNNHPAVPPPIPAFQPITEPQPRFLVQSRTFADPCDYTTFIHDRVGSAYSSAKIRFEIFDREDFWDKIQGGGGRETGAVFC